MVELGTSTRSNHPRASAPTATAKATTMAIQQRAITQSSREDNPDEPAGPPHQTPGTRPGPRRPSAGCSPRTTPRSAQVPTRHQGGSSPNPATGARSTDQGARHALPLCRPYRALTAHGAGIMPHEGTKDLTARPAEGRGWVTGPAGRGRLSRSGPPRPGTDRPPGTARLMQAPGGTEATCRVTCCPDVADATCTLSAAVRGGLLAPEERAVA
jgi:hypothetical protein